MRGDRKRCLRNAQGSSTKTSPSKDVAGAVREGYYPDRREGLFMLTILADYTFGGYVALVHDSELGAGVCAKGHWLWFGANYLMAREVYDLSCVDAGATTFRNHEAPTC